MCEPVGLADGLEFIRLDAAQHKNDVHIGGRSQASLCPRTEQHHREKVFGKRPPAPAR